MSRTVEDVKYCGEYSVLWRMFSTVKGCLILWRMFDTVEDVQHCGGYSLLFECHQYPVVKTESAEYSPQYDQDQYIRYKLIIPCKRSTALMFMQLLSTFIISRHGSLKCRIPGVETLFPLIFSLKRLSNRFKSPFSRQTFVIRVFARLSV